MTCDYCGARATTHVPTIPGRVCEAHARQFWIDLLAFARNQRLELCEDHETPGVGVDDVGWVKPRVIAVAPAAQPTQDVERQPLRRAS
jgi:hypothetical protein